MFLRTCIDLLCCFLCLNDCLVCSLSSLSFLFHINGRRTNNTACDEGENHVIEEEERSDEMKELNLKFVINKKTTMNFKKKTRKKQQRGRSGKERFSWEGRSCSMSM